MDAFAIFNFPFHLSNELPRCVLALHSTRADAKPANPARAKPNLTDRDRQDVVLFLLERSIGGVLSDGDLGTVAAHFSVSIRAVAQVWKRFKDA
ncbi:hypothetical protein PI125_g16152 [Phytophthora idaei]|nr:hypothetical protein PI125_g16152 [Phytophthora idaei]